MSEQTASFLNGDDNSGGGGGGGGGGPFTASLTSTPYGGLHMTPTSELEHCHKLLRDYKRGSMDRGAGDDNESPKQEEHHHCMHQNPCCRQRCSCTHFSCVGGGGGGGVHQQLARHLPESNSQGDGVTECPCWTNSSLSGLIQDVQPTTTSRRPPLFATNRQRVTSGVLPQQDRSIKTDSGGGIEIRGDRSGGINLGLTSGESSRDNLATDVIVDNRHLAGFNVMSDDTVTQGGLWNSGGCSVGGGWGRNCPTGGGTTRSKRDADGGGDATQWKLMTNCGGGNAEWLHALCSSSDRPIVPRDRNCVDCNPIYIEAPQSGGNFIYGTCRSSDSPPPRARLHPAAIAETHKSTVPREVPPPRDSGQRQHRTCDHQQTIYQNRASGGVARHAGGTRENVVGTVGALAILDGVLAKASKEVGQNSLNEEIRFSCGNARVSAKNSISRGASNRAERNDNKSPDVVARTT